MTQTTTAINGCDAAIWCDDDSGTLKDISGSSNEFALDLKINVGATPTFGSRWPKRLMCGRDASLKLVVVYTTAADEGADIIKSWALQQTDPGPRTIKLYVPDKNVGSDVYSGEWVLESASWDVKAGEAAPLTIEATLLPDGAVTLATNAT